MKKLLIVASMLTGMVAGAMVLSSFSEPKEMKIGTCKEITMADDWTLVGKYYGKDANGMQSGYMFNIWQKEGMCNQYYWVYGNDTNTPDKTTAAHGVLRQNKEGKWYVAYNGTNYFIDF